MKNENTVKENVDDTERYSNPRKIGRYPLPADEWISKMSGMVHYDKLENNEVDESAKH